LITPGIDDEYNRKRSQKKKRGRKNKYYKQIDAEDDQEAHQISVDDSDNDGLDNVKEEDDESRDSEEEARRR